MIAELRIYIYRRVAGQVEKLRGGGGGGGLNGSVGTKGADPPLATARGYGGAL